MPTVYISIGNSDGKLNPAQWSCFYADVDEAVRECAVQIHGVWHSMPAAEYVNACWCVFVHPHDMSRLKAHLAKLAGYFRQDSIAWAEAETELLTP